MMISGDLIDTVIAKVLAKANSNNDYSSSKTQDKSDGHNYVPFSYARNFVPNSSSTPLVRSSILDDSNFDEWANKMKDYLVSAHPSLWEIVNVGVYKPNEGEDMTNVLWQ